MGIRHGGKFRSPYEAHEQLPKGIEVNPNVGCDDNVSIRCPIYSVACAQQIEQDRSPQCDTAGSRQYIHTSSQTPTTYTRFTHTSIGVLESRAETFDGHTTEQRYIRRTCTKRFWPRETHYAKRSPTVLTEVTRQPVRVREWRKTPGGITFPTISYYRYTSAIVYQDQRQNVSTRRQTRTRAPAQWSGFTLEIGSWKVLNATVPSVQHARFFCRVLGIRIEGHFTKNTSKFIPSNISTPSRVYY